MKKKIIIPIVAVIIAAAAAFLIFHFKNNKSKSKFAADSVEMLSQTVIADWLDTTVNKDVDRYISDCFTEELLQYYENSLGMTDEQYREYVEYTLNVADYTIKNIEVQSKEELSEEEYSDLNIAMSELTDRSSYISHMYKVTFTYTINIDGESDKVTEDVKVMLIDGKCYIDVME